MASKPPKVEEDADSPAAKGKVADKKLLLELRERYKKCVEADRENRKKYRENMRFALVPGEQWDETSKKERGKDRVMYEFNEIRIKGKAIVNQIRANRPSAKITPAEGGDIALAEAMKAQVDQIQNASDGDAVQDYAAYHQVFGGMGAERYVTAYQEDSVDGQDILIEPINNPMCLYADYACQKQDKSDARFWILASKLTKDGYKEKHPNAEPVTFDVEDDFEDDCDDDHVWIAEYWVKKPVVRTLARLSDGRTVDMAEIQALPDGVSIVKKRNVPGHRIVQYICSGDAVLSSEEIDPETGGTIQVKEHPWAGAHFPFNIVYGEYTVIDGKVHWCGITEYGKDAQRAHNWAATSFYEAIASTPQATTWVTAKQAGKHTGEWAEAQRKNFPIRVFDHDPNSPGPPQTTAPPSIPTALVSAIQISSDSLKASLGMPDATLGEKSAENSGVAIRRRQEAGAVANFNFGDNMTFFHRRRVEILIDLIPKVKDTFYILRVVGKDGAEKAVRINDIDPMTGKKINDLSSIKYDLVVTQGPNFATQRQEAAETFMGLSQGNPALMGVAGDLIVGSLDLPKAQEIAERLKATLPPPIQAMLNQDKPQDPAVVAAMEQVKLLEAQLQEQAAAIEEAGAQAQQDQSSADKAKADVQIQIANLKTQQAELATQVAEFQKLVAETQLKMAQQDQADSEANGEGGNDELVSGVTEALAALQAQSAQQTEALAQLIQELAAEPVTLPPSQPKTAVTKRVNGAYVTELSDGRVAVSQRQPGGGFATRVETPGMVQ